MKWPGLLRMWYADENALVRQKLHTARIKRITPWLSEILRRGLEEGVFTTGSPDKVAQIVVSLLNDHGNTLAKLLLSGQIGPEQSVHIEGTVAAYTETLARVLGAPDHCLQLVDVSTRNVWFFSTQPLT